MRMPVMHVTWQHAHSRSHRVTSKHGVHADDKPTLLAIVHSDNITTSHPFSKNLQQLATEMYKEVVVAVLDAQLFSRWASLFRPKRGIHEGDVDTNSLLTFPRFCIVDWNNHSQAAFYPPLRCVILIN